MTNAFEQMMNGLSEVESFLGGNAERVRVHVPPSVDVKEIRGRLRMTQASFSETFGFSLDAVKHWEGGRRTPEVAARAYLTVIAREPDAVIRALQRKKEPAKRSKSTTPAKLTQSTTRKKIAVAA